MEGGSVVYDDLHCVKTPERKQGLKRSGFVYIHELTTKLLHALVNFKLIINSSFRFACIVMKHYR